MWRRNEQAALPYTKAGEMSEMSDMDEVSDRMNQDEDIEAGAEIDETQEEQPGDVNEMPRQRVRILYAKQERIKFISHQDEFRAWERALRRSGLPLLYKRGFNPQPHIQFASPLGVGFSGRREPVDITFSPPVPLAELQERLAAALPPGLTLTDLAEVPLKTPARQNVLAGADYSVRLYAEPEAETEVLDAIGNVLRRREVWRERERKGKRYRYNLRPLILELGYRGYDAEDEAHVLALRVQQRPGATGRPDEVVAALGLDNWPRSICRERLYFEDNPDDAEAFAAYRVVTKDDIAEQAVARPARPSELGSQSGRPFKGRTIAERAADEFV